MFKFGLNFFLAITDDMYVVPINIHGARIDHDVRGQSVAHSHRKHTQTPQLT